MLLAPNHDQGAFAGRIRVAVPRMGVGESTATTLAMVIHELATNSVKHGALSLDAGMLEISSTSDEQDLILTWAETGGPTNSSGAAHERVRKQDDLAEHVPPVQRGPFLRWQPTGLVVTLRLRKDRLAA